MSNRKSPKTPNRDHFEDSDDEDLPEVGRDNKDGTIYGGGPRNIHCSACKAAGFPEAYGHGHRKGQWKFCPVAQRNNRKHDNDSELDPMTKSIADEHVPHAAITQQKSNTPIANVLMELDGLDPDELMLRLTEGKITAQQAKMALLKSTRAADEELKVYIRECMSQVDTLAPKPTKATATKLPGVLVNAGKLIKLWTAISQHVKLDMHANGKADHQQTPKMNVITGELTVDVKEDEYAATLPMFYLTLEHFRHLVRARDYLTESECHAMVVWTSNQLSYGRTLKVVERSLKKMFDMLDADMNLDLGDVIDSKGLTIIQHQLDIASRTKPDDRDIFRLSAVEKKKERRKRQESDHRTALPLKAPNDSCCWY